jgi:hypothetical protein
VGVVAVRVGARDTCLFTQCGAGARAWDGPGVKFLLTVCLFPDLYCC